ncbi:MAG: DUF1318 domain-containing protein [Gammaproteobacteria bacterium]
MKALSKSAVFLSMVLLVACVTINVYFPAAAAEKAADRFIGDIYNPPGAESKQEPAPDASSRRMDETISQEPLLGMLLNWVVSPAYGAIDINVKTPAIDRIKASMTTRHKALTPFYNSGAIGMTGAGLITVRDLNAVKLPDRRHVQQLVADENRDRNALYPEIARASGHPEWEKEIRSKWAERWVANAPSGWWYQQGTAWQQKQKSD